MNHLRKKLADMYTEHSRTIIVSGVMILSGWFIVNGLMQIPAIKENREETAKVENKIKEEKERQAEIDDLTAKVNTDEYIERIASEKLGLVKSNATIFYDVSQDK